MRRNLSLLLLCALQGLDGGFSCSQDDIVIVVAAQEAKDANGWKEWSGADKLSQLVSRNQSQLP